MKNIISILIFLFLFLIGNNTYADENVTITASAPKAVVKGSQFKLTYTINTTKIKDFRAPSIADFDVLMGPTRSHQSSTQIINGKVSSSSSVTYTFVLLGQKEGTFVIPEATVVTNDKTLTSNAVAVNVLPPDNTTTNQGGSQSVGTSSSSTTNVSDQELFILASVSKANVYEQEAFLLTYKVYSLVELTGFSNQKLPDFKNFHSQEVELPKPTKYSLEHYNGRNYRTFILHQYVLFPQQSGKLEIPSAQFEGVVAKQVRSLDPFDAFFNGGRNYVEIKKTLSTKKLSINVESLPPGKPASFAGAVGNFSISSSISSQEVKTNDAITIKVVISGTGNMKLINTPEVDFPKDFEIYDPKVENKFSLNSSGLSGSKVVEYLAIPRHSGNFKIPPIEFSFFDLKSKIYKTLKTEEFQIKVEKGAGNAEQVIANFTNKEDLKMIGSDIRFIKLNDTHFRPKGKIFYGSFIYYLWYIIPLCLFIVFVIIYRKQAVESANIAKMRTKKANKMATKRLKLAKKLLQENNKAQFYDEVLKALWGYISDKLNIPLSRLSKGNIEEELRKYGVDEQLIKEFIQILDDCEFARYAPGDERSAMDKVYQSAIGIISKMENRIKH